MFAVEFYDEFGLFRKFMETTNSLERTICTVFMDYDTGFMVCKYESRGRCPVSCQRHDL